MGLTDEDSYAVQLAGEDLQMAMIVALVPAFKQTDDAHREALTSPFFHARIAEMPRLIAEMELAIRKRDIGAICAHAERDTLMLHGITMTGTGEMVLWQPDTLRVILAVRRMREAGIPAFFSIDTGATVYVNTVPELADEVRVPLEEAQPEALAPHAGKSRGALGIPLEGDDERADLILLAIATLLEGEGLLPQAIHLRANRFDPLPQIRGVHARRDRPHAARGPRVEARERVVGEALFIPEVPAEAAVQADPPEQEVRQVQRIVVLVTPGDARRADHDVHLGLVGHRNPDGPGSVGRRGRDRLGPAVAAEAGERRRNALVDQGAVDVPRDREDEPLRAAAGLVERHAGPPPHPPDAGRMR